MKPQALLVLLLVATFAALGYFLFSGNGEVAPANLPTGNTTTPSEDVGTGKPDPAAAEHASSNGTATTTTQGADLNRTAAPEVNAGGAAKGTVLRGRLVDRVGKPRGGVIVSVDTWRSTEAAMREPGDINESREEVTTSADGSFQARVLTNRSGTLALPDSDLVFEKSQRFTAKQAELDLGDVTALLGGKVQGIVKDENGKPVGGVKVVAQLGLMGFSVQSNATSGDDGTFAIGKLRPGEWVLATKSSSYLPTNEKVEIEAEQQLTDFVLVVKPGHTIAGRVVDDRGVGVAGMKVASQRKKMVGGVDIQRFTTDEAAVTDAQGNFKLAGLEGKTATIRTTGPGHTKTTKPNVATNTNNVTLRVDRLATITGVVVAADGTPMVGTRISARSPSKNGGAMEMAEGLVDFDIPGSGPTTKSDEQGKFVLADVRPGTVTVKARGQTHLPIEQAGVPVAPAEQVTGIRLIVDVGAIARIKVVDDAGQPIPSAKVAINKVKERQQGGFNVRVRAEVNEDTGALDYGNRPLGSGDTDENGVAVIMGLPAGNVDAVVTHASFAPSGSNRITMPASGTIDREIALATPSYVDVVVTDTDGSVSVGTDVLLEKPGAGEAAGPMGAVPGLGQQGLVDKKTTDVAGKVRFGPLAAGDFVVALSRGKKGRGVGGMMMFVGDENDKIKSSATSITVGAGKTESVKLQFPVLARLTGSVTGSDGPVAGCVVELADAEAPAIAGLGGNQKRTDESGNFVFDGVESGKYTLRYGKPDQVVKANLDVDVPPNTRDVHRDLTLRTGSVRVLVLSNEDAEPVERAEVRLMRAGQQSSGEQPQRRQQVVMIGITNTGDGNGEETSSMTFGTERVVTDDDGIAVFEDVPVGEYTLEVESSKFAPGKKEGVAVVELQLTDCGTIELTRGGQIRGRVTGKDGKPKMAVVERRLAGSEGWDDAEMAMRGSYRLRGLAPGRYEVRARAIGGNSGETTEPETVEVKPGKTAVMNLKFK